MSKIHIGGAGGAPSNNFILSLKKSRRDDYLVGTSSNSADLFLANVDEKYVVPCATDRKYEKEILSLLDRTRPDFLHVQNDYEVLAVSTLREKIEQLGVKLYLPNSDTIQNCVDKFKSYEFWEKNGIVVPKTFILNTEEDLKTAFDSLGEKVWIRATVGAGGSGSLPADNFDFAKMWVDRFNGWGKFTASKCLSPNTVTWLSIWYEGELVVAQSRKRHSWSFGNRAVSGVTGVTAVGETCSDKIVDKVAQDSIFAIDSKPHGIFGVDMTYDENNIPNPTEINIGRFFTTHYFFTEAGLNMPEIYCDIAIDNKFPSLKKKINPLPNGLLWIRGMDVSPVLTTLEELEKFKRSK